MCVCVLFAHNKKQTRVKPKTIPGVVEFGLPCKNSRALQLQFCVLSSITPPNRLDNRSNQNTRLSTGINCVFISELYIYEIIKTLNSE